MKLPRLESSLHPLILLAPLVSVIFCFLFFFLFSNNFLFQPGITIKLPQVPFLAVLHHDPLIIAITGNPQPEIYFENEVLSIV